MHFGYSKLFLIVFFVFINNFFIATNVAAQDGLYSANDATIHNRGFGGGEYASNEYQSDEYETDDYQSDEYEAGEYAVEDYPPHLREQLGVENDYPAPGFNLELEQLKTTSSSSKPKKIYKRVNEHGVVEFSDTPTANANWSESEQKSSALTIINYDSNLYTAPAYEYHNPEAAAKEAEKAQLKQQRNELKKRIATAKQQLEDGKKINDDDWQRTIRGRRFLKPSYHQRVENLEKNLLQLKQQLGNK